MQVSLPGLVLSENSISFIHMIQGRNVSLHGGNRIEARLLYMKEVCAQNAVAPIKIYISIIFCDLFIFPELVDFDKVDQGCDGGLPSTAYKQIMKLGNITLRSFFKMQCFGEVTFRKTCAWFHKIWSRPGLCWPCLLVDMQGIRRSKVGCKHSQRSLGKECILLKMLDRLLIMIASLTRTFVGMMTLSTESLAFSSITAHSDCILGNQLSTSPAQCHLDLDW